MLMKCKYTPVYLSLSSVKIIDFFTSWSKTLCIRVCTYSHTTHTSPSLYLVFLIFSTLVTLYHSSALYLYISDIFWLFSILPWQILKYTWIGALFCLEQFIIHDDDSRNFTGKWIKLWVSELLKIFFFWHSAWFPKLLDRDWTVKFTKEYILKNVMMDSPSHFFFP